MFIPTTIEELDKLNWKELDIILVSGDTYIDTYYDGIVLIGKLLIANGYKVGIIAQPSLNTSFDILRLGEPKLFWGVSGGSVDSMVSNYTALKKKKKTDDLTPGGINNRRPDRACIVYSYLIQRYSKHNKFIVLGGIEASLRRIAHYDYIEDKIRRSILFDSKADCLIYGMGEKAILELAECKRNNQDYRNIKGLCYISNEKVDNYIEMPSFEEVIQDKMKFIEMFNIFYKNNDPITAQGIYQKHSNRYLIQNPPQDNLSTEELDKIYSLDFERDVHPYYKQQGKVIGLDTIQFSITTHRGCFGECNFCSIAVHQGRTVVSRSINSITQEAKLLAKHRNFKGYITNIGGPTANMYGMECKRQMKSGSCLDKRCDYPEQCKTMNVSHKLLIDLLKELRRIEGLKAVFIGSGIRYDLILKDKKYGEIYLENIIESHISGQLKIAPEHIDTKVTNAMGKPNNRELVNFINKFYEINKAKRKKQYLTYYFIAGHPECSTKEMLNLRKYIIDKMKVLPEQVQIFTPTPSTYSSLMYYTEIDPFNNKNIFVEKNLQKKLYQKELITKNENKKKVIKVLNFVEKQKDKI